MKKAVESKGKIWSRSPGSWSFRVEEPVSGGGSRQRLVTVRGNRKDAEKKRLEMLHEMASGAYVHPAEQPFADYLAEWLRIKAASYSPTTVRGYDFIIQKHLGPSTLGRTRLGKITPHTIQSFLTDKMASGLSPRSVRHQLMLIKSAFRAAVKSGIVKIKPTDAVDTPRCERHEITVLSAEQVAVVLREAENTAYGALFNLALVTGARRSELLALRVCDCDLPAGTISIRHSLYHDTVKGDYLVDTKTKSSTRLVPLPPSGLKSLANHIEDRKAESIILGTTLKPNDFVFVRDGNLPLLGNSVSHCWHKLMTRLGFDCTFHGARHSHATILLRANTNIKIVSERLGHSSTAVTGDIYQHVSPVMSKMAALKFDELIQPCAEALAQS